MLQVPIGCIGREGEDLRGIGANLCRPGMARMIREDSVTSITSAIRADCFSRLSRVKWILRDDANGHSVQHHCRRSCTTRGASAAVVVAGEIFRRAELPGTEAHHEDAGIAHRLRKRALPEHGGMLGAPDGNVHDPRKHLHARVRILRRAKRQTAGSAGRR